jgi:hypothetical protein
MLDYDVVVIAQKVVSKAEGRYVDLDGIEPGKQALALSTPVQKDPRLVEVILRESRQVLRHRPGVLIVEHRLGFVLANAGVDQSNVDPTRGVKPVLLLPEDPDASARLLHEGFREHLDKAVAVVINDSLGRAWRLGTVAIALGAGGSSRVSRSARPARFVWAAIAGQRNWVCRRDRRGGIFVDGAGGRSDTDRCGTWSSVGCGGVIVGETAIAQFERRPFPMTKASLKRESVLALSGGRWGR